MKYKILVLDIDGTLTNNRKEITPHTLRCLQQAQQAGVRVVLASGRPTAGIMPLAKELKLERYNGYILSYNGARIIECSTQKTIYESTLPHYIIEQLYRVACEHELAVVSYDDIHIITENGNDQYVEKEKNINKMPVKEVEDFVKAISFPVPKCLIMGDSEKIVPVQETLKQTLGNQLNIYRSEPFFLELMPLHIDKAYALQQLLNHTGYKREEMIACGDGFNDLSMIEFAGLGVAMENAQPEIKKAASYITTSNEDEGIARVIEKFIFNEIATVTI